MPKVSKWALIVISVAMAAQLLLSMKRIDPAKAAQAPGEKIQGIWSRFSPDLLAAELGKGKTVIVNFTADWCVTCKVNESVAFENEAVRKALQREDVVAMLGDWTNGDPVITEFMAQYGRNSVPVYLVYPKGAKQPVMLPQILTPKLVLEHLK